MQARASEVNQPGGLRGAAGRGEGDGTMRNVGTTVRGSFGRLALAAMIVVGIGRAAPAVAQQAKAPAAPPPIDPKVAAILRAACDTLSSAQTMSFTAVNTYERAARNGQPLYYTVMNKVTLQRPDKLRVIKVGDGIPDEFYYDGKTMTAYIPAADLIAVADAPPTIDEMIDAAWNVGAVYFPFADVIVSKPCEVFQQKMKSAFYVGQSVVVGGTKTDMVAVAGDDIQAELWIGAADHLPRMVRVSYPHEPAHAHYQTDYSDWHLGAVPEQGAFATAKAATAKRIQFEPPGAKPPPQLPPAAKPAAVPAPAKQP